MKTHYAVLDKTLCGLEKSTVNFVNGEDNVHLVDCKTCQYSLEANLNVGKVPLIVRVDGQVLSNRILKVSGYSWADGKWRLTKTSNHYEGMPGDGDHYEVPE